MPSAHIAHVLRKFKSPEFTADPCPSTSIYEQVVCVSRCCRMCELTAEIAYRTLLGISLYIEVFVCQALLSLMLPAALCQFLAFAHLAWFYAFSSFECVIVCARVGEAVF